MTDDTIEPPATLLASLYEMVSDRDYDAVYSPADGMGGGIEKLHVNLGVWDDCFIPLTLLSLTDLTAADASEDEPEVQMLHGSAVLPFDISKDRQSDVVRVVFMINRALPLCSFGVSVEDGSCYIQTCISVEPGSDLPYRVAEEHIGMTTFAVQSYGPLIAGVASGELTYQNCVDQLAEMGVSIQPVPAVRHRVLASSEEVG